MEFDGTNYLIPTDARLANDFDVEDEAIPLDRLLAATRAAKKLSLIILDACRENPFLHLEGGMATKRVSFKGLVPLELTGTNTLVAYAAKAGSVSFDGSGANSPFTTALVKYIAEPGLDIRMALGKVRDEVLATTGNAQEPSIYGSLGGSNIFLVPASSKAGPLDGQDADHVAASDYEKAERLGSRQAWQVFLAAHNSGYYVSLARIHLARLQPIEAKRRRRDEAAADRGDKADHSCAGDRQTKPGRRAPAALSRAPNNPQASSHRRRSEPASLTRPSWRPCA